MNKRILITGAAKRIGKEMALSFFKKGWDIVIHFNASKDEAESLADQMNAERFNSAMLVQANLDNTNEVEKLVATSFSKSTNSMIVENFCHVLFDRLLASRIACVQLQVTES